MPTSPAGSRCQTGRPVGRHRGRVGFTLLELLVVLVLIGLLSAVAVPGLTAVLGGSRVDESVKELVRGLRAARQAAVLSGRPQRVTVNGPEAIRLAREVEAAALGPEEGVVFYPTGMSGGGGWRVGDGTGDAVTVRVSPLDGAITVER